MDAKAFPEERRSLIAGSLWMLALSVLLFFLPGPGGLAGGIVGGYKVGGVARALGAALLPALFAALAMAFLLANIGDISGFALLIGLASGGLILLNTGALLLGAAIGGLLGRHKARARYRMPSRWEGFARHV